MSSARALCDIPRNVPDDVIAMLPMIREYNTRAQGKSEAERAAIYEEIRAKTVMPQVRIAAVADHIDYIRKMIGVDYIGIGSDYDGNTNWPEGLSDVSMYPNLFAELVRRGWSDEDLAKIAGGNVLRALEQAEAVARRFQQETPPN